MPGPLFTWSANNRMTTDCPDGYCKQKIQAIDNAIGHKKNEWSTLLHDTENYNDVNLALRFCEIFHLEPKVSITSKGYVVKFRSEMEMIID